MLHILFLTHWYPSSRNPIEGIFIQEHARALALRHKVSVIHILGTAQGAAGHVEKVADATDNITAYHVSYSKPTLPKSSWLQRLQTVERLFHQLSLDPQPPELIHAQVYSSADLAVYLGRRYRLPIVLSEHASTYARNLFSASQGRKARFFLNRISLIMPVCEALQRQMQRYGIHGPFEVVPNAVDVNLFHPALERPVKKAGEYRLIQVASLNENKAVNNLIQAVAMLVTQYPGIRVNILGEGPERNRLENLTREYGVARLVQFVGLQTKAQVADWMQASDCFVLTSNWENQPAAVLEALACGLPVVATNVGGLPEIITDENGILTPPGNPKSLAEAVSRVIQSPELYPAHKISELARQQYSYPVVAARFDACYQQVLGAGKP